VKKLNSEKAAQQEIDETVKKLFPLEADFKEVRG
jgi:hypothetical protein